jgi:hypothetical protein
MTSRLPTAQSACSSAAERAEPAREHVQHGNHPLAATRQQRLVRYRERTTGTNNALSGLTQQFRIANRIYTPYGGDFSANAMATNASSIAGVQAAVQQLIASAQQHSQALQGIEGQLSGAT